MPAAPCTKLELLTVIQQGRSDLRRQFETLDQRQMRLLPGPQLGRSVKDLIAHITWWEEFMIFRVSLVLAGDTVQRVEGLDAINEQVYASNRSMPLNVVLSQFENAIYRLQATLEPLTWEQIDGGIDYLGGSLLQVIASNTYEHYAEHLPELQRFVQSQTQQQ